MAFRTASDGPVFVRSADLMTPEATRPRRGDALEPGKCVRGPINRPRVVLLAESNQVRWHALGTANGRPRGQRVAAARKLLVFGSVAAAAVQGGEIDGQREVVVVLRFLAVKRLMAV